MGKYSSRAKEKLTKTARWGKWLLLQLIRKVVAFEEPFSRALDHKDQLQWKFECEMYSEMIKFSLSRSDN